MCIERRELHSAYICELYARAGERASGRACGRACKLSYKAVECHKSILACAAIYLPNIYIYFCMLWGWVTSSPPPPSPKLRNVHKYMAKQFGINTYIYGRTHTRKMPNQEGWVGGAAICPDGVTLFCLSSRTLVCVRIPFSSTRERGGARARLCVSV